MPLSTGKSCSILDSFGDKICKMLDKKLEDYIAENGKLAVHAALILTNYAKSHAEICCYCRPAENPVVLM